MRDRPLQDRLLRTEAQAEAPEIIRVGKDEVNLVEYPFAALSTKPGADATIVQSWQAKHPITGRPVKATWRVEGSRELGLPNATDERVYLVLMELTREAGMTQEVYFTRYDILRRLDWPIGSAQYEVLQNSFRRLKGVVITSENAFWNPEAKSFVNVGFNLIDNYKILASKPGRKSQATTELPLSYFRWNDVIYNSLNSGYIRSLNLGFALSLKLPLALRLYRYLDRKAHDGKHQFEIELSRLCQLHLGMTPTPHNSTMKVRLNPAHNELIEMGFLHDVTYSPMKSKKGEKVCYIFRKHSKRAVPSIETGDTTGDTQAGETIAAETDPKPLSKSPSPAPTPFPGQSLDTQMQHPVEQLLQAMLAIKVSPAVAKTFLETVDPDILREQLDCLSDRNPDDLAATFVSAVRGGWQPPAAYHVRQQAAERVAEAHQKGEQRSQQQAQERIIAARLKAEKEAQERAEIKDLDKQFEKLSPALQAFIDEKVGVRMQFVLEHVGREAAVNGWQATRRQVLRERNASSKGKKGRIETASDKRGGQTRAVGADNPSLAAVRTSEADARTSEIQAVTESGRGESGPDELEADRLDGQELDAEKLDPEDLDAEEAASLRKRTVLAKDSELDKFYASLDKVIQQDINNSVQARLKSAGMNDMHEEHPGFNGVRRTILRQRIQSGDLKVV